MTAPKSQEPATSSDRQHARGQHKSMSRGKENHPREHNQCAGFLQEARRDHANFLNLHRVGSRPSPLEGSRAYACEALNSVSAVCMRVENLQGPGRHRNPDLWDSLPGVTWAMSPPARLSKPPIAPGLGCQLLKPPTPRTTAWLNSWLTNYSAIPASC